MTRRRDSSYRVTSLASQTLGKELFEPLEPNQARHADLDDKGARASVFARVKGEVHLGLADDRFRTESDAAAADHHAGPLGASLFDDAVRIGQQKPFEHHLVVGPIRIRGDPGGLTPLRDGAAHRGGGRPVAPPPDRYRETSRTGRSGVPQPRPASRDDRGRRKEKSPRETSAALRD